MKLFLIIYALGEIGGVAGPLPYALDECNSRKSTMVEARDLLLRTGLDVDGNKVPEKNMRIIKTMRFSCEWRAVKPSIGDSE